MGVTKNAKQNFYVSKINRRELGCFKEDHIIVYKTEPSNFFVERIQFIVLFKFSVFVSFLEKNYHKEKRE